MIDIQNHSLKLNIGPFHNPNTDSEHQNRGPLEGTSGNEFQVSSHTGRVSEVFVEALNYCKGSNKRQLVAKRQRQSIIQNINIIDVNNENHQQLIIEILKDQNKSSKDMAFLRKAISNLPLFQKNPELLQNDLGMAQLFSEFSYQFCRKNHVIFNYGDFGYTYYIILKGSVFLLIPKLSKNDHRQENVPKPLLLNQKADSKTEDVSAKQKSPEKIETPKFIKGWKILKSNIKQLINNDNQSNVNGDNIQQNVSWQQQEEECITAIKRVYDDMNLIKTFQAGEAFGEISLITKQRRTGTMVCKEDTHLMVLTKNGFDKILGQYHEQLKNERLGFLRNFSFYSGIPNSNLLSILLDMKIESFPRKAILYTQNERVEKIFFLKKGQVQLSKVLKIFDEEGNGYEEAQSFQEKQEFLQKYHKGQKQSQQSKQNKLVKIATLPPGSCFGLEDIDLSSDFINSSNINNNNLSSKQKQARWKHSMTAEIISENAEIYSLNKYILLNNLHQFQTLECFAEIVNSKKAFFSSREEEIIETSKKQCQSWIKLQRKGFCTDRSSLPKLYQEEQSKHSESYTVLNYLSIHQTPSYQGNKTPSSSSSRKYSNLLNDSLLLSTSFPSSPSSKNPESINHQYAPIDNLTSRSYYLQKDCMKEEYQKMNQRSSGEIIQRAYQEQDQSKGSIIIQKDDENDNVLIESSEDNLKIKLIKKNNYKIESIKDRININSLHEQLSKARNFQGLCQNKNMMFKTKYSRLQKRIAITEGVKLKEETFYQQQKSNVFHEANHNKPSLLQIDLFADNNKSSNRQHNNMSKDNIRSAGISPRNYFGKFDKKGSAETKMRNADSPIQDSLKIFESPFSYSRSEQISFVKDLFSSKLSSGNCAKNSQSPMDIKSIFQDKYKQKFNQVVPDEVKGEMVPLQQQEVFQQLCQDEIKQNQKQEGDQVELNQIIRERKVKNITPKRDDQIPNIHTHRLKESQLNPNFHPGLSKMMQSNSSCFLKKRYPSSIKNEVNFYNTIICHSSCFAK